MVAHDDEWDAVVSDSRAAIEASRNGGVHVFGGGLDASMPVRRVPANGSVTGGGDAGVRSLDGGFTVLKLPSREAAVEWAARMASACRCDQQLRVFHVDDASLP